MRVGYDKVWIMEEGGVTGDSREGLKIVGISCVKKFFYLPTTCLDLILKVSFSSSS